MEVNSSTWAEIGTVRWTAAVKPCDSDTECVQNGRCKPSEMRCQIRSACV